jgi:hypothetical protein
MPKNTQLLWIAEAEARRFEQLIRVQRAASEPRLSVVSSMHGAARCARWRRLMARLRDRPDQRRAAFDAAVAPGAETSQDAGLHEADSALADLVETSFDGQRG